MARPLAAEEGDFVAGEIGARAAGDLGAVDRDRKVEAVVIDLILVGLAGREAIGDGSGYSERAPEETEGVEPHGVAVGVEDIFDEQAATYDQKWSRLAPINQTLHLLAGAVLTNLPAEAHLLCVGAGTGNEILALASRFPDWRFTAIEPSLPMLEVCHLRCTELGIATRCTFHAGYLDSLPPTGPFDAATAFLVSQFIQDREARARFFRDIAKRLRPDGVLISSDLAGDPAAPESQDLLAAWYALMSGNGISAEGVAKMREAYVRDVSVLPPAAVEEIIVLGGFTRPTRIFQAGLIHAWFARQRV